MLARRAFSCKYNVNGDIQTYEFTQCWMLLLSRFLVAGALGCGALLLSMTFYKVCVCVYISHDGVAVGMLQFKRTRQCVGCGRVIRQKYTRRDSRLAAAVPAVCLGNAPVGAACPGCAVGWAMRLPLHSPVLAVYRQKRGRRLHQICVCEAKSKGWDVVVFNVHLIHLYRPFP